MNILAFDTCFAACSAAVSVAVGTSVERIFSRFEPMHAGHAERLVPMVGEVMADAGLSFADLDRIGVTTGPGSFVGTRVGVSAARAFALTCRAPVFGISSLAAMARQAALVLQPSTDICVVVDVRRGEVYAQVFDSTGLDAKSDPQLLTFAEAAKISNTQSIVYVGSGATDVCALASGRATVSHVLALAIDAQFLTVPLSRKETKTGRIEPFYLRPPDAKPSTAAPLQRQ